MFVTRSTNPIMFKQVFILFFLFFSININAQTSIGFQLGSTNNKIATNISNRTSTSTVTSWGYSAGIAACYQLNKYFFAQVTPMLLQKNYSINRTGPLTGVYTRYNNSYLQLPVSIGVTHGKRLQWYAGAGLYIAYWLSSGLKGKVPDIFSVTNNGQQTENFQLTAFNKQHIFSSTTDNRVESGWLTNGGVRFRLTKKYIAFANCSYYQALTSQQKQYMINQVPQYNQTLNVAAGVYYLFNKQ